MSQPLLFLLLVAQGPAGGAAQDWPHWRGPDRNGVVTEPSGWGGSGWPLQQPVWTGKVGDGNTSPLVVQGRLYTLGWAQEQDNLCCLEASTGKEIWKKSYPCPPRGRHHLGDEKFYSGPIATPEFDSDTGFLFTLSIDGDLQCWDTRRSGRKVWGLNLYGEFGVDMRPHVGAERRDYGYITSPLLQDDSVLVQVGAREGSVMAFARETGKRKWTSECKDPAGHSGGMAPMTVEGVPCVALLTLNNLVVVRLDPGKEGRTVATYPWTTDFGNNIATPAVQGDSVLVTSEYNHRAICRLQITLGGATKVWEKPYASKACSPVIYKDSVYFAWQRLRCLDFATGEQRWDGGNVGDAGSCIVTGDGKLIVWGGAGRAALVETSGASPDAYRELAGTARIFSSPVWPQVVLSGGRLYCKDRDGNLKCFQVRETK
jgi:outer membrane protein assembly factor BamB